jgi:hypothetical protein
MGVRETQTATVLSLFQVIKIFEKKTDCISSRETNQQLIVAVCGVHMCFSNLRKISKVTVTTRVRHIGLVNVCETECRDGAVWLQMVDQ